MKVKHYNNMEGLHEVKHTNMEGLHENVEHYNNMDGESASMDLFHAKEIHELLHRPNQMFDCGITYKWEILFEEFSSRAAYLSPDRCRIMYFSNLR